MNNYIAYQIVRNFVDGLIPRHYRPLVARWLRGKEDMEAKETAFRKVWEQTSDAEIPNLTQSLAIFQQNRDAYEQRCSVLRQRRRVIKYAASLLLLLAAGGVLWFSSAAYYAHSGKLLECSVPNGMTDGLTLSDGTHIRLNAGSTILYPRKFSRFASHREVYLEGEAHFDVAKDTKHPFIVHVGNLRIRVLGTQFNVKAYVGDENVTTTLEEGKINVSNDKQSALLNPGEQLVYNRINGHMRKFAVDSGRYNAWMQGKLVFEQEPLYRVIADVCRKYNVEINVDPSVDMGRRYTMSFQSDERVDDVMKVITKIAGNLMYQHEHGRIVLKTKKGGERQT